jgi:hypothetical protein
MTKIKNQPAITAPLITVATLADDLGLKVRAVQVRARNLGIEPRADLGGIFLFTPEEAEAIRAVKPGRPLEPEETITRSARSHRKRRQKERENKLQNS